MRGNGEIQVADANGEIYVAPALIWHYVMKHDYHPPDIFVRSVMDANLGATGVGPLSATVLRLADEPTLGNRRRFYETFVKSRVGVRVPDEFRSVPLVNHITSDEDRFSVPLTSLADGTPMLLVQADVDKLAQTEAGTTFMELAAKDVIEMAIENKAGIIIQAQAYGRQAWAGIAANDVANL